MVTGSLCGKALHWKFSQQAVYLCDSRSIATILDRNADVLNAITKARKMQYTSTIPAANKIKTWESLPNIKFTTVGGPR
jgi:hypothetical protein